MWILEVIFFLNLTSLSVVDLHCILGHGGNGIFLKFPSLSGVDSLVSLDYRMKDM